MKRSTEYIGLEILANDKKYEIAIKRTAADAGILYPTSRNFLNR